MKNILYNENNLLTMKRMPNKFLDGIICSPPYNLGKNPNHRRLDQEDYHLYLSDVDELTTEEYLELRLTEFKEFDRVLKDKGVICYNMSYSGDCPILPILLMNKIHEQTNLTVTDIISWKKATASPFQTSPNKLTRLVELVYIIVHKDFLNTFQANKEVSSINEKTGQKFFKNYTNIIEAQNNDKIKSNNKALFSSDLVSQLLYIYFPEGSLIYDCFMGIGTTARACRMNNRNFVGSEMVQEFYLQSVEELIKI